MPVQQVNILVKTWLVLISETHDYLFGNTWPFFINMFLTIFNRSEWI